MKTACYTAAELERVRSELTEIRKKRQDELLKHNLGMEVLRMKVKDKEKAYDISLKDNMGKRSPLHRYIEAARRSRGAEATIPTYVLSLEGQLCRSMHHMLVLETDLAFHQESCAAIMEWMRIFANCIAEEKARIETDVVDSMASAKEKISFMEEFCKDTLNQQEATIKLHGGGRRPPVAEPMLSKTVEDNLLKADHKTPINSYAGRQISVFGRLWVNLPVVA